MQPTFAPINHYTSNLRDIEFNLFEFLAVGAPDGDRNSVMAVLGAIDALCRGELASSFVEADRVPLRLSDGGDVLLPEGLKRSLKAYYDAGAHSLALPAHLGGSGAPSTVAWAAFELVAGANAAISFYVFSTFAARVLDRLGTASQKQRFVRGLVEKRWGASMALTEPDAGSDVGVSRTSARHWRDDVWELEGVKRFISNGDYDGPENIIHLVLARPVGASAGTKGLSLFVVPKFWVHRDGSLGERNGVRVTHIETKMGIKGSATCELTFGEHLPARGLLVGDVHDGIRQMFTLIEHARMAVGVKSMAALSTAYLNALTHARNRVQGAERPGAADETAAPALIVECPDARRMLMAQKAHAEGMRALALFTASVQDDIERAGGPGAAAGLEALNGLLLPLVKGYCSEKAYEILALSLQTCGASGYTEDYPVEQYIRDQKIDSLYEGTTHMQALDLVLRKIARDGGGALRELLGRIRATVDGLTADGPLSVERRALREALGELEAAFSALLAKLRESLYHVGLQGNRLLFALAEVVIGWLLIRHADVALRRCEENPTDRDFYAGKLGSARWWCRNVLPSVALTRHLVESSTLELMAMADGCF